MDLDRLKARISSHIHGTDAEIEAYALKIQREVERVSRQLLKRLEKQNLSFSEIAAELGGLEQRLIDAGIIDQIDKANDIFLREMSHVSESFALLTGQVEFTGIEVNAAEALINYSARQIQGALTSSLYDITEQTFSSYLTGQAPDIEAVLETSTGKLANYVRTELATATSGFNRTITAMKAEQLGLTLFLYLGPMDNRTREFCAKRVNKVYPKDEIAQMDNGQGLDVMIYGGGYRCRHEWRPVSADLAKRYGYEG